MSQQDLIDFVSDPGNIKKAVEGSMEKRRKVLYPNFSDRLDVALGVCATYGTPVLGTKDQEQFIAGFKSSRTYREAKEQIIKLVLDEVIGEDAKHPGWCGTSCDLDAHVENQLRAEQRKKIREE